MNAHHRIFLSSVIMFALLCVSAPAQDAPFVSKSLFNETVTATNGAVTVKDALAVNELMGAHEKVVHEITGGVYHIRGWGIAHTARSDRAWLELRRPRVWAKSLVPRSPARVPLRLRHGQPTSTCSATTCGPRHRMPSSATLGMR